MIDAIIALIRGSDDRAAARDGLMADAVRVQRDAGRAHPRHAASASSPASPRSSSRRRWPSSARPSRARGDPRRRARCCARVIKNELAEVQREVRRRAALEDHPRRRRHEHRGPHRRRGARRHAVGQGLHQDRPRRLVPVAGPRRARRGRRQAPRRGLRQPHPHHHRPRLPAVLLEPRPRLPAQGARDPEEGAHRAGHGDAEPAAAPAGRAHPDDHRHARLRDEPVPVLRHQAGPGEEDEVQRVRLVAAHRHHRHQPARRRRAGEGDPHQRRRRHPHAVEARAGHPLHRGRRPPDGSRRRRRAGHEDAGRATRS